MRYYHTTGLTVEQITDLTLRVHQIMSPWNPNAKPHLLGLWKQVVVVLILCRHNMTQEALADVFGVSQPTISRIWRTMSRYVARVVDSCGISLNQAVATRPLVVDGTYVPTGNRHGWGKLLYSGKRKCQCVNIQVACDLSGILVATSQPVCGAHHDAMVVDKTGWEDVLDQGCWIADAGYIATGAITPVKKPLKGELTNAQKSYNKDIYHLRYVVEQCIAHLKNWKILKTGYRGRLCELPHTIHLVTQLELYRLGW